MRKQADALDHVADAAPQLLRVYFRHVPVADQDAPRAALRLAELTTRIADELNSPLGEVVGRSPGMMTGYHGQPAKTREAEWFDDQGRRFLARYAQRWGEAVRSALPQATKDWNDAVNEVIRLDNDKVNRSGAETLSVSANVFMGQTEAPLIVKPFVPTMTRSTISAMTCR